MISPKTNIVNALKMFWNSLKSNVIDHLSSYSSIYPLSANQGRVLQGNITSLQNNMIKIKVIESEAYVSADSSYNMNINWNLPYGSTIQACFIHKVIGSNNTVDITFCNFIMDEQVRILSKRNQTVTIIAGCIYV